MDKQKLKIVVISFFDNSNIKGLPILTQASTFDTKEVNIAMISVNAYCLAWKLKEALVFAVSIKDLKYQTKKVARPKIDLKSIIPKNISIS